MGYVEVFYSVGDRITIKADTSMELGKWAHCDQCDKPTSMTELLKATDGSGETLWWLCQKCNTSK
jgi:RNase P subunit RPR2